MILIDWWWKRDKFLRLLGSIYANQKNADLGGGRHGLIFYRTHIGADKRIRAFGNCRVTNFFSLLFYKSGDVYIFHDL